ncbi:hypothetical protein GPJ56_005912 [Histomonas meleagridis]|uniref:uncharacterized protein n=1 Tax=Histomonas meleagridis TaxID=135588 RepID=UPI003559508F|nr:hypothetical protein GPJ56_005912 [Histomonas meleagridis]KAH0801928.1 hypothetical protein GO595_005346 [Histomonas meleagridis]
MEKVGCNHLVIAGLFESDDYPKAEFLSMHLEQHLNYTIERQGKLKSQWKDYYQNTLVPLEITSPEIESGKTIVFTREGRIIGGFEEYRKYALLKYGIDIEYDDKRMKAIQKELISKAQTKVDDQAQEVFDEKVDKFLKEREEKISEMQKSYAELESTCKENKKGIIEIDEFINTIQPYINKLQALHKQSDKENEPSEDKTNQNNESDNHFQNTETENLSPTEEEPQNPDEENVSHTEETPQNVVEENLPNEPIQNVDEEVKKEENEQIPTEEEDEEEAIELQIQMQESLKFPPLTVCKEMLKTIENSEQYEIFEKLINECDEQIKEEKFKWKMFEKKLLSMKDKIIEIKEMIKSEICEKYENKLKELEKEINNYDEFIIPNVDEDVLNAAALKYAATYQFA